MRRFWNRRGEARLVSRLEGRRRKARPDFVQRLAEEIRPPARRRFPLSRALLASTLTLIMLAAVASVGGAGASVRNQLSAVVHSVNSTITASDRSGRSLSEDDDDDDDGDDDQYEEERRECRRAVYEAHRLFHWRPQLQNVSHRGHHRQLEVAQDRCSSISR